MEQLKEVILKDGKKKVSREVGKIMDELVNVLTEQGENTGKIMSKLETHKNGICHGVSVVAIIDNDGRLLIQKRAKDKKSEPGKWDLSAAGHIDVNESPEEAAIRETYEEIGVIVNNDELIKVTTYLCKIRLNKDTFINHYTYLYIIKKNNIDVTKIKKQDSEVDEIKLINLKEYQDLFNNNEMVEGAKYCVDILKYMN